MFWRVRLSEKEFPLLSCWTISVKKMWNLMTDNLLYLKFLLDSLMYAGRMLKYREALEKKYFVPTKNLQREQADRNREINNWTEPICNSIAQLQNFVNRVSLDLNLWTVWKKSCKLSLDAKVFQTGKHGYWFCLRGKIKLRVQHHDMNYFHHLCPAKTFKSTECISFLIVSTTITKIMELFHVLRLILAVV